jgi:RNA polymerase sigma-70 factor, ECF subfamily
MCVERRENIATGLRGEEVAMQKSTSLFSEYSLLSDGALARKTLAGEQDAFEAIISRYQTFLFRFACHYLKDDDAAEDILQHVWIQLHLSMPNLSSRETLRPWLLLVTRNACLDELRRRHTRDVVCFSELNTAKRKKEALQLAAIQDPELLPEEMMELLNQQQELQQAMQKLPLRFRTIVYLRCIGQLDFTEIGHKLNMPRATAKTYYYRALPRLRTALDQVNISSVS